MERLIELLEPRYQLSSLAQSPEPNLLNVALSTSDVRTILAQAASQALPTQAIVVVDREGQILGVFGRSGLGNNDPASAQIILDAAVRARTAAAFQSSGEAFTTRTARFIIQDHFPWPVQNTPAGPLYGVEFSSLRNSDVLLDSQTPAISGDPGGIPLYINGVPVGGIGVAGDGHDFAARPDFVPFTQSPYNANPRGQVFNGQEEHDFDEAVALAGARGYMAPDRIRATHIFIDGLRLPFTSDQPAAAQPQQSFSQLVSSGAGSLRASSVLGNSAAIRAGEAEEDNFNVLGQPGLLRMRSNAGHVDPQASDPIVSAQDGQAGGLTAQDVLTVIQNAVRQALNTRAGIRKPNGVHAVVHVAVVDLAGNVLGVFRMHDGTNFSYDVAVQKARTAAFFSDDSHAFSTRAIGFLSQYFFPPGIPHHRGPLFQFQNEMDVNGAPGILKPSLAHTPLADGITIFPGGVPLYKNGMLVGAVGVSGDGVDQDDIISFAGSAGFRPPSAARSDQLSSQAVTDFVLSRAARISDAAGLGFDASAARSPMLHVLRRLRLPYVKFPRNPRH